MKYELELSTRVLVKSLYKKQLAPQVSSFNQSSCEATLPNPNSRETPTGRSRETVSSGTLGTAKGGRKAPN